MSTIKKIIGSNWFLLISFFSFMSVVLFFFSSVVFSKNSLCFVLLVLTGLSFYMSIWFRWNPTNFFPQLSNILITIATIFMAIATCQTVNISNQLGNIEEQNLKHNIAVQEIEFRPYLAISLPSQEYAHIKMGEESNFLKVPFQVTNVGKYPAIGIKAEYSGPIQNNVQIEPEGNIDHLLPGDERVYVPNINIGKLIEYSINGSITTDIQVKYQGILKTDENKYCSRMQLIIKKEIEDNKIQFSLVNSTFRVQCD